MKILIKNIAEHPSSLLRRAGYVFQRQDAKELSFVRVFSQSGYPRFHCYAHTVGTDLTLSLHLDHKKHTYGDNATRHHGAYENEGPVREEGQRLLHCFGDNASVVS